MKWTTYVYGADSRIDEETEEFEAASLDEAKKEAERLAVGLTAGRAYVSVEEREGSEDSYRARTVESWAWPYGDNYEWRRES